MLKFHRQRRTWLGAAVLAAVQLCLPQAHAGTFPDRPVKLVMP